MLYVRQSYIQTTSYCQFETERSQHKSDIYWVSGIANDSAGPEGSCQNRSRDQRQVTNLASTWPWCPTKKQQVRIEEGERGRERDCLYYTWVLAISSFAPFPPLLDPSKPQLRPWHCGPQCYESAGHTNQESYRIALELGLQATQVTRTSARQDFAGCSGGYEPAWLL